MTAKDCARAQCYLLLIGKIHVTFSFPCVIKGIVAQRMNYCDTKKMKRGASSWVLKKPQQGESTLEYVGTKN